MIGVWRVEYNTEQLHSALDDLVSEQFAKSHQEEEIYNLGL